MALCTSLLTDLCFRKIYDWVTLPAIFLLWAIQGWRWGWGDWGEGFSSGLLGGLLGAGFFAIFALWNKGLGWGDVKLMGVVGAALGWPQVVDALLLVSLFGALQALISIVVRNVRQRGGLESKGDKIRERFSIPYGISIALGGLGSLIWSFWMG